MDNEVIQLDRNCGIANSESIKEVFEFKAIPGIK